MGKAVAITPEMVESGAAAIANARGMRRGAPSVRNVLDILPDKLRAEVVEDAEEALKAALASVGAADAVARAIEEGGWWSSCTGCHETINGHETGHYPHSPIYRCHVGAGCCECGGIGVVWHRFTDADAAALEAEMAGNRGVPPGSEDHPPGTAGRLIQRLENANAGGLFCCDADREEAVEIASEEIATALAAQEAARG